jgi:hypothetical protein
VSTLARALAHPPSDGPIAPDSAALAHIERALDALVASLAQSQSNPSRPLRAARTIADALLKLWRTVLPHAVREPVVRFLRFAARLALRAISALARDAASRWQHEVDTLTRVSAAASSLAERLGAAAHTPNPAQPDPQLSATAAPTAALDAAQRTAAALGAEFGRFTETFLYSALRRDPAHRAQLDEIALRAYWPGAPEADPAALTALSAWFAEAAEPARRLHSHASAEHSRDLGVGDLGHFADRLTTIADRLAEAAARPRAARPPARPPRPPRAGAGPHKRSAAAKAATAQARASRAATAVRTSR